MCILSVSSYITLRLSNVNNVRYNPYNPIFIRNRQMGVLMKSLIKGTLCLVSSRSSVPTIIATSAELESCVFRSGGNRTSLSLLFLLKIKSKVEKCSPTLSTIAAPSQHISDIIEKCSSARRQRCTSVNLRRVIAFFPLCLTRNSDSTDLWAWRRMPGRLGDCLGWDRCSSCAGSLGSSRCSRRASTCVEGYSTNRGERWVEGRGTSTCKTIMHPPARFFWHCILLYFNGDRHQSREAEATSVRWLLTGVPDSKTGLIHISGANKKDVTTSIFQPLHPPKLDILIFKKKKNKKEAPGVALLIPLSRFIESSMCKFAPSIPFPSANPHWSRGFFGFFFNFSPFLSPFSPFLAWFIQFDLIWQDCIFNGSSKKSGENNPNTHTHMHTKGYNIWQLSIW